MSKMSFSGMTVMSMFFALLVFAPRLVLGQVDASELKKFQGTWKMVSGEMDGQKLKDEHVKKSIVIHTGDKVKLYLPHHCKDTMNSVTTKLDPSKDLKIINWVRENGHYAGKNMPAIYKFEGSDIMHICFDPTMATVPENFGTDVGSGHIWHTFERVK